MKYRTLHRLHIWLAWLVGVPLLFWTISGLWMVARPIEEVRGAHLRAAPLMLDNTKRPIAPTFIGKSPEVESIKLVQQATGKVWIAAFKDKSLRRASAVDGRWIGVSEADARTIARAAYLGKATLTGIDLFPAAKAPLELRKERPSWQARFADDVHVYVDADSGEVLALRTKQWRAYDWMWGLHIMDLEGREDTHHPILIGFAGLTAMAMLLAFFQLIWRQRRMGPRPISRQPGPSTLE